MGHGLQPAAGFAPCTQIDMASTHDSGHATPQTTPTGQKRLLFMFAIPHLLFNVTPQNLWPISWLSLNHTPEVRLATARIIIHFFLSGF